MNPKKLVLALSALLIVAVPAFGAWHLVPCDANGLAKQAAHRQLILSAAPGTNLWLPRPYPKKAEEVVADFRHQYLDIWRGTDPAKIPQHERDFIDAVRARTVKYQAYPVANWRSNRCEVARDGDMQWLLRIVRATTGEELARANLQESGLFESISVFEHSAEARERLARHPIPDIFATVRGAAARGINGNDPQLVVAWGELRCPELYPCVAFRAKDVTYVQKGDELYRIAPTSRRFSYAKDLRSEHDRRTTARALAPGREKLMSLGGDVFVVVEKMP